MDSLAQKSIFLSHKLCIIARNFESLINFFKVFSGIGIPLIYAVERSVYCLVGRCVRRWVKRCICFLGPLFQIFQLRRRICDLILKLNIYRIINSTVVIRLSDLALYTFQSLELFRCGLYLSFQKIILLFPQLSSLKPCLACVVYSLVGGGNGTVNLFERAVYLFKACLQAIVTEPYLSHIAVFIGHNITPFPKIPKAACQAPFQPIPAPHQQIRCRVQHRS